ncbi:MULTISPECIES: FHA domain-containing protein [Coprococcus]|jgi:hypothetical protein|uniref:FHA domain-containing protein n=1 Tax=Coprococcus ammoniilyticus TaxID=2981785 RepID=A0ABV1EJS7_9FIRM|nr:FHA domain-containing protein [Clostridium sp. AF15-31]RHV79679.1 FHA domain-containing protein [Clostridium sp. OF10-22XD]
MRKVNFKVRNIGSEKYLSYVLDDETDLDEELLDYLDDNKIAELIDIIYEEDDENDYLTYNITDRTTVGALLSGTVHAEMMLGIIRGVASGIMNMRDLGIPVSYVILNKDFTYVNPVTFDVKMICIPVGSDVAANAEFKAFVKDLILNATYADDEDCNYVAKLINMLNVEKFTIRGFVSQITELMEAAGLQVEEEFMDVGDSGVEVSQGVDIPQGDTSLDDLPEFKDISFDDDDDDGLEMYEEEPTEENTIFKDLDLNADVDSALNSVNMDLFDESNLEELTLDEDAELEETAHDEAEPETEEAEAEDIKPATEIPIETPEETEESEGMTEMLTGADLADIGEEKPHAFNIKEIAHTAEGVTEISAESKMEEKPVLIDTQDLDNLIEKPPVMKNIRINRAKIIQKASVEMEDDEVIDNPTEQIRGAGDVDEADAVEPETLTTPVPVEEKEEPETGATGTTVELTGGMSVVQDQTPEEEKKPAPGVPKAMPYIIRVNTKERVMVNKAVFKLGKANRGVDFTIDGNGAISRVHAIIYQRDDGCYLKDNKATNATLVDGVKLEEGQEVKLKNDATITIGGEDFIFKLS